jgi:hypothetical protein
VGTALGVAAALLASSAFADDVPRPDVHGFRLLGDGCAPNTVVGTLGRAPDGQWNYDLVFTDFQAVTDPGRSPASRECGVAVDVTPPPGYRMRIASMLVQGTHVTYGAASTKVSGMYTWWPMRKPSEGIADLHFALEPGNARVSPTGTGDLRVAGVDNLDAPEGNWGVSFAEEPARWSKCADPITVVGTVTLTADRGSSDREAELSLQRSDVGLGWGWKFERCGGGGGDTRFFDGHWISTYAAPGGQLVRATIDAQGDEGTYQTSTWSGRLFDLHADGDHVLGSWAALNRTGWLDFEVNGGQFTGKWGFQGESGEAGAWWGHR